jgi:hypothetical protein
LIVATSGRAIEVLPRRRFQSACSLGDRPCGQRAIGRVGQTQTNSAWTRPLEAPDRRVVANNSSGISVVAREFNALPNPRIRVSAPLLGGSSNTADAGCRRSPARALEPELHSGPLRLRDRVRANPTSMTIGTCIRSHNGLRTEPSSTTHTGHRHPAAPVIGSEGTAFIGSATFRTLPTVPSGTVPGSRRPRPCDTAVAPGSSTPGLRRSVPAGCDILRAAQRSAGGSACSSN